MTGVEVPAYLGLASAGFAVSLVASDLLEKKQKKPIVDEKPSTTATRGSFIPINGGRRRIGPHVAWVGDRTTTNESNAGGKGVTGNGSQQIVYRESAHHILCIGPGEALHRIWSNGKIIYEPAGGINRQSHPSGSSVAISGFGTFVIYWGEADSPIDTFLASPTRVGVASRWKFLVRIVWKNVRLGGFPTWPSIEYEPEVRPYKPGMLVGVSDASLPERLNGSNGWIDNEFGADASSIFNILDGFTKTEVANGGTIKIAGDHAAVFPANSKAKITGQPYAPFVSKLLNVVSSAYVSGETYYTPHGYVDNSATYNQDMTDASWVKSNLTAAVTTSPLPPAGTTGADQVRYLLTNGGGFPNTIIWNGAHSTSGDRKLGRYRNRVTFYVYRFGQSGFNNLKIGLIPFVAGPTENFHTAQMNFVAGEVVITNGPGIAKLREILPPPDTNWRKFELVYVAGHGPFPSNATYDTQVLFETTGNSGPATLAGIHWDRDNGNSATGVTTLDFTEDLERVDDATGTVQSYRAGFGPGGPNAAHLIHQYLFETYPHGAGLDESQFDIPSLEAIGTALESVDGLRTNVYAPEGKEFEQILGSIFTDCGILCAWDRISAKFVFTLVRDPNLLSSVPNIPEELIADPLPERVAVREQKTADKAVFGFPDVALGYRDNVVITNDDGRASIDQNQKGNIVPLETAIDTESAVKIAERRAQEVLVPVSKASITVLRDAGDFFPGKVITAFDFDEVLRILEVKVDPKTRRTVLDVVADSYSLSAATQTSAQLYLPQEKEMPAPDISVAIFELPAILNKNKTRSIAALRIRANAASDSASAWISEDNLTYKRIYDNSKYVTGGILLEDIADGTSDISTGPVIYALGPDITSLAQSLTNGDWALGRQLWVCGNEMGFLQDVVPLGEGYYRLDGLKRAQYRTPHEAHAAGQVLYIIDPLRLDALYDPLVRDAQLLYVKAQPKSSTDYVSLSEVTPASKTITVAGPTSPVLYFAEVPAGTIDGVNDTFTVSYAPNPASSLLLVHNRTVPIQGSDYTVSGNVITFIGDAIPQPGDSLLAAFYQAG